MKIAIDLFRVDPLIHVSELCTEVIVVKKKKTKDSNEISELLSFQEEALVRLRDGVVVDLNQPLEKKTNNKALLSQLEQLEQQIFAKAQR